MHRVVAYGQNGRKRRNGCSGICGICGNGAFKTACACTLDDRKKAGPKAPPFSLEIRVHANEPCNLALRYARPPVRVLSRVHLGKQHGADQFPVNETPDRILAPANHMGELFHRQEPFRLLGIHEKSPRCEFLLPFGSCRELSRTRRGGCLFPLFLIERVEVKKTVSAFMEPCKKSTCCAELAGSEASVVEQNELKNGVRENIHIGPQQSPISDQ
jgi:hypothetical protein